MRALDLTPCHQVQAQIKNLEDEKVEMAEKHAEEIQSLNKKVADVDLDIFRTRSALDNVSAQVVARNAKIETLELYAEAKETEVRDLKTALAHCEDSLKRATEGHRDAFSDAMKLVAEERKAENIKLTKKIGQLEEDLGRANIKSAGHRIAIGKIFKHFRESEKRYLRN